MNEKRKKTYSILLIASVTLLFLASAVFYIYRSAATHAAQTDDGEPISLFAAAPEAKAEMRGVWIASVVNINFPSKKGLSVAELKAELDDIVQTSKAAGLNTIFFQVRPAGDALYASALFPVSEYLTGTQGSPLPDGFDPLAYIIEKTHENGMRLEAWINPYRITYGSASSPNTDVSMLAENNPARLHPEWTVAYVDGKLYYNPGIPEVRQLIVDGVAEIVRNYDVDGIHMDDYFYPYPQYETVDGKSVKAVFQDLHTYETYQVGGISLDDWRRQNVDKLVEQVYRTIKEIDASVDFGISPFGIWANNSSSEWGSATNGLQSYYDIYCNPIAWIEGGYIDYLCPQIYWEFSTKVAPFDVLVKWWSSMVDGTDVDLYIGHAAYRIGEFTYQDEIVRQVEFARKWMGYQGSVFYGYAQLKANTRNLTDRLKDLYREPVFYTAPVSNNSGVIVSKPADGRKTTLSTLHVLAVSDPLYPVFFNGKKVARTKSGFFNLYLSFAQGENLITLVQNWTVYETKVTRYTPTSTAASYSYYDSMQMSSPYPTANIMFPAGTQFYVSVNAPSKSKVTARIGDTVITLYPTVNPPDNQKYMVETYTGTFTMPSSAIKGELVDLGRIRFTAQRDGETSEIYGSSVKLLTEGYQAYVEVVKDYSFLKISRTSSFYDDFLNASAGMRDAVVNLHNGYYRLKFGGYIAESDVIFVDGGKLLDNKILTTGMSADKRYTTLRFGMTEHVPLTADCRVGRFVVSFFNTDAKYCKELDLKANPLFSSCVMTYSADERIVTYTLALKQELNYYGYDVRYENNTVILEFTNPQTLPDTDQPLIGKRIIVDAGHGGADNGATGYISTGAYEMNESDANLKVALALRDHLESLGAVVYMTRTDDSTVSIDYRMDYLNEIHPDLSISVHHNALADESDISRVRGFVGLYWSEAGKALTKAISNTACRKMFVYERNYAQQMLALCRNYKFPQTLVELGFITCAEEYEAVMQPDYAKKWAAAIAEGVLEYYRAQEPYLMK